MSDTIRALRENTHQKGGKPRRWDLTERVYNLLESGPKTLSKLYRLLNPGVPNIILRRAGSRGMRTGKPMVDKRIVKAQIEFLMRKNLVAVTVRVKVLHHDIGSYAFTVKYYYRTDLEGSPTPCGRIVSPEKLFQHIHNPFNGEEGMLRYMRWLRDA